VSERKKPERVAFCPQDGRLRAVDQEGLCPHCGATCMGDEIDKLFAALRLCEKALNGLLYRDPIDGDVFCDHAAPPCHKCDNCRAALAAIREMGVGDGD